MPRFRQRAAAGRAVAALALLVCLAPPPVVAQTTPLAPCPPCDPIAAEVNAARDELARLRQEGDSINAGLQANDAAQRAADKRLGEIDAEIKRQENTFVSGPQPDGSTLTSRYDLAAGEIVTTRTRPGGAPEEVSRTGSEYLQKRHQERDQLDKQKQNLANQQADLDKKKADNAAATKQAGEKLADLEKQLADCIEKNCKSSPAVPTTALVLDRTPHKEFVIHAGQNPTDVTAGMPGVVLFALPGGGWQASVPVPADPAAANALNQRLDQLVADGRISDLQDDPCRKFLPFATTLAGHDGIAVAAGQPVQILKGSARTSAGQPVGTAIVILFPQPPPVTDTPDQDDNDKAAGWIPHQDDQPPPIGTPGATGDFVVVIPPGYPGPYVLALGIYCNCFQTTSQTNAGTATVTSGPKTAAAGGSGTSIPAGSDDSSGVPAAGGGGSTGTRPPGGGPGTQPRTPGGDDPRDTPGGDDPRDKPKEEDPCYCGPDMTPALTETANRLRERIAKLPDSEKGMLDGPLFMNRNADSFDTVPAAASDPDAAPDAGAGEGWLCPSPKCRIFGKKVSARLCGYCLPYHMFNEINAGFVASGIDVPFVIFAGGANTRELLNYLSLEGNAPAAAYNIAYALQEAAETVGDLTAAQVCKLVDEQIQQQMPASQKGIATMPALTIGTKSWWDLINEEYPGLKDCEECPDKTPGHFSKDFSHSEWTLDDGSKVGNEYTNRGDGE